MNKVILLGRTTKDITLRYSTDEISVARFSLAIDRVKQDGADFINCVAFGKTAETLEKYVSKGTKIAVEGRWQTGSYEKDGQKVYTNDCIVDRFYFCESKKKDAQDADFEPLDELPF